MARLRRLQDVIEEDKPTAIFRARYDIIEEIRNLYRISHGISTRYRSYYDMFGKGGVFGTEAPVPKDSTSFEYEDNLINSVLGPHALQPALEVGLQAAEYILVEEGNRGINDGEYLVSSPEQQHTMQIAGVDNNVLMGWLLEQTSLNQVMPEKMAADGRFTKEQIAGWRAGLWKSIIDPTGKNGYTTKEFTQLLAAEFDKARTNKLTNLPLFLMEVYEDKDGKMIPLDISTATEEVMRGEGNIIRRNPLSAAGLTKTGPTVYAGETRVIAFTPESLFHAINVNSNFEAIFMMEYHLRTGAKINVRETTNSEGKTVYVPREALSNRVGHDLGFNFKQDRQNEQMLLEAFEYILGDEEKGMIETIDDQSLRSVTRFLDARRYLGDSMVMKFHTTGKEMDVSIYEAGFLAPLQEAMTRLNYYGTSRFNERIDSEIEINNKEFLLVLATMLRDPKITEEAIYTILPQIGEAKVNEKNTSEEAKVIKKDRIKQLMAEAELLIQTMNAELRWRDFNTNNSHFRNTPTDGWQGRINPFDIMANSFMETLNVSKFKDADLTELREAFNTYVDESWSVWKNSYEKKHKEIADFFERHKEELKQIALDNALLKFLETVEAKEETEIGVTQTAIDAWKTTQKIDPKELKKYRQRSAIINRWENHPVQNHAIQVLNDLDSVVTEGLITEHQASIFRTALAWYAEHNEEIFYNLRIRPEKNIPGIYAGFAEKREVAGISDKELNIYGADPAGTNYEANPNTRHTKNLLLLTGMDNETINAMPEFQEGWLTDTNNIIGVDIETDTKDPSLIRSAIIAPASGSMVLPGINNEWTASDPNARRNKKTVLETLFNNEMGLHLQNKDDTFYVDKDGNEYARVTGLTKEMGKIDQYLAFNSTTIGTNMDTVTRDFFNGTLKSYADYVNKADEIAGSSFFADKAMFDEFITNLQELKTDLENQGYRVIKQPEGGFILHGEIDGTKVAGTVDLLVYNEETDSLLIYDMKTSRRGTRAEDAGEKGIRRKMEKYNEADWQKQLSMYSLLLNQTYNIDTDGTYILPIAVDYASGDWVGTTEEASIYKPFELKQLNEVKTIDERSISRKALTDRNTKLTQEMAQQVLDSLEAYQNAGYKVITHNGNEFDLNHLGTVANNRMQAARITLRSFDTMQMLGHQTAKATKSEAINYSLATLAETFGTQIATEGITGATASDFAARAFDGDIEAYNKLLEYNRNDAVMTANTFVALMEKSLSAEKAVNLTDARGRTTRVSLGSDEATNILPSWRLGDPESDVPWAMRKGEWKNNGLNLPRNTVTKGSAAMHPEYLIGLDTDTLKRIKNDTMSVVELLFHELTEIAILKYANESSVEFGNLVRKLEDNMPLLEKILRAHEGEAGSINVRQKLDYYTNKDHKNELVAAFVSYYVSARVLGEEDGVMAEITEDYHKSSFWGDIKRFMGKAFSWIGKQYQNIAHVFIAQMDEPGGMREMEEMLTMMNLIFGLDEEGNKLSDVQNAASDRRYLFDFKGPREQEWNLTADPDMIMGDAEYSTLWMETEKLNSEVNELYRTGKSQDPSNPNYDPTLASKDKARIAKQKKLQEYGYKDNNDAAAEDSEGHNWAGLTRGKQLALREIIKKQYKKRGQIDGLAILNSGDTELMAAYAFMLSENFTEYLGSRRFQGLGGAVHNLTKNAWVIGEQGVLRKAMLASSGAFQTYNSPFDIAVILANMLVDGSTLTKSGIMPNQYSIVSAQAASRVAQALETTITQEYNSLVYNNLMKDEIVTSKLEGRLSTTHNRTVKADAVATLNQKISLLLDDPEADVDVMLKGYSDVVIQGVKDLRRTYRTQIEAIFRKAEKANRPITRKDTGILPIMLKQNNRGETTFEYSQQARAIFKEVFSDKIIENSKTYMHPVMAYTAELLPRKSHLATSLEHIKKEFPLWFEFLAQRALTHYRDLTDDRSKSLESFMKLDVTVAGAGTVVKAWNRTVRDIFSSDGDNHIKWDTFIKFHKGSAEAATELSKIQGIYNARIEEDGTAPKTSAGIKTLLNELYDFNKDMDPSDRSHNLYLNSKAYRNELTDNPLDFLIDTFMFRIQDNAYFVKDSVFLPSFTELMAAGEEEGAHLSQHIETHPALLARSISRSQGHRVAEIDMFKPITKSNLDMSEMLRLFAHVTNPNVSGRMALTDGKGVKLDIQDQAKLHNAFQYTMPGKYEALKGSALRLKDNEDVLLNKFAHYSNSLVRTLYGGNLAFATSVVEGSMAGMLQIIGHNNMMGFLTPLMSYLRPLIDQDPETAKDMIYALRIIKGDDAIGLVDQSTISSMDDASMMAQSKRNQGWLYKLSQRVTAHASRVNQQLKAVIDNDFRVQITKRINNGSWLELIKLIEAEDMDALLEDKETSWSLWKDLTKRAGWGPRQWRLAMTMAKHGMMTTTAYNTFNKLYGSSKGSEVKTFHLYKMRQQVELFAQTKDFNDPKIDTEMAVLNDMKLALQELIETVMVAPNVMDLNIASNGLIAILHQYRTYPMLFTSQRFFRDSSKYEPTVWAGRMITNIMLDMLYTICTFFAGGYKVRDFIDDMEKPEKRGDLLLLLATRLPLFGIYGAAAFELVNAVISSRQGQILAPISLAGLVKYGTDAADVIVKGTQAAIPGGKGWDTDKDTASLINLMRVVPGLSESIVRGVLHNTIRTRTSRGSMSKWGGNKEYMLFGMSQHDMQMQPRYMLEEILGEIAPDLIPEDLSQLTTEDFINMKRGVDILPERGTAQSVLQEAQGQPSPDPQSLGQAAGASPQPRVPQPEAPPTDFLKAPKQLSRGGRRSIPFPE